MVFSGVGSVIDVSCVLVIAKIADANHTCSSQPPQGNVVQTLTGQPQSIDVTPTKLKTGGVLHTQCWVTNNLNLDQ